MLGVPAMVMALASRWAPRFRSASRSAHLDGFSLHAGVRVHERRVVPPTRGRCG
jgi:hypothetical protein